MESQTQGITQDELKLLLGSPDLEKSEGSQRSMPDNRYLPRTKRRRAKRNWLMRLFNF